jgi:HlyD family secretion protein
MKSVWIKRFGYVALAAAVIGGFAYALREHAIMVDTAKAVNAPMTLTIQQEGVTRVRDVYTVSAPIAGHLSRTVLEEGSRVAANTTVVASIHPLDPPLIDTRTLAELTARRDAARAGLAIAELELKRARNDLGQVERELERAERLARTGITSEAALQKVQNSAESLRAQAAVAQTSISQRKAELDSIEAQLTQPLPSDSMSDGSECCVTVTAPIDGVVLAVHAKSEQPVSVGARIADIGDSSRLEVVIELLSSDAVRVVPGTAATITDWGGDTLLKARVKRIDPAAFTKVSALGIEEQRVNAVLELLDSDARLGHGFRVNAEIPIWESRSALQVPISALFRTGDQWTVFVVSGNRAKTTGVEIGHMNDDAAEVLAGLSEGDTVITHPNDTLGDGGLVEMRASQ